jgi:hypothetical protein
LTVPGAGPFGGGSGGRKIMAKRKVGGGKKPKFTIITEAALGNKIVRASEHQGQPYHLFLGAGASIASHVRSTGAMIRDFEKLLDDVEMLEAIRKQDWYQQQDQIFARLFEAAFPQAIERSNYVAACLQNAKPSSGYYYLAALIHERAAFRVTMTTNFDDLLAIACITLDSRRRPLELWDKTMFRKLAVYQDYPVIAKLHGDYRDPQIKNTLEEIGLTYEAFHEQFKHLSLGAGMVVCGYSGEDKVLTELLLNHPDKAANFFPHGIYWCLHRESESSAWPEIPPLVASIAEIHKGLITFVDSRGFDSLMHVIYGCVAKHNPELRMPRTLSAGFTDWLGAKVKAELDIADSSRAVEYAIPYLKVAAAVDLSIVARAAQRVADLGSTEQADRLLTVIDECQSHFAGDPMITFDLAVAYMWLDRFKDAEKILDIGERAYRDGGSTAFWNEDRFRINKCLVKQAAGKELTEEEKAVLRGMLSAHKLPEQMGAAILLGQSATAVSCIETLVQRTDFKNDREALRKWYIVHHFLRTLPPGDWTGASRDMFAKAFESIEISGSDTPAPAAEIKVLASQKTTLGSSTRHR